jgi:uncharacterized membrane protein YidH (DUF202 family)
LTKDIFKVILNEVTKGRKVMLNFSKIAFALFICILILTVSVLPVFAEVSDVSGVQNESSDPPRKDIAWAYVVVGVLVVGAVVASAVYITKRVK